MRETASIEHLYGLVEDEQWDPLQSRLVDCHPADIAELIDKSPSAHHKIIFSLVADELKPDVLAELESVAGADILEALTNVEISDIVEEMAPDDAADIIGELPEERSEEVLALMEAEESEDVRKLLQYKEDTAGGIMTTDVVSMGEDQTVGEALDAIAYLDTREKFYIANIVDGQQRLMGYVDVWDLLRERDRSRHLGDLIQENATVATVDMDQEHVAQLIQRYDLAVLPVVDHAGRLVGRITADDVIDVIEEEASEDIFRLAGSDDAELDTSSPLHSCRLRLPWLFVTLFGGFLTSLILRYYQSHVAGMLVLVAFVPIVLAMGGSTGIQASTLVVRSLALGSFDRRHILRLLGKEVITGALMGLVCGVLIGAWAAWVMAPGAAADPTPLGPFQLAAVVSVALFVAMSFATLFGAFLPILLDRAGVDPAVASGPFVTITNDVSALLIYFGITMALVHHLA